MTKHGEKSNQSSTAVRELLENDPKAQATELGKKLAAEATVFIKANPWVAVLGAAAIGYFLGSTRRGSQ